MGNDSIDRVLRDRRCDATETPAEPTVDGDRFFSVLVGEGVAEHFLEVKLRSGTRVCFSYDDLSWFNYSPEAGFLDLDFAGFTVSLNGRGFGEKLFNYLKQKRVAWVKESDTEMQDNPKNALFIKEITIKLPDGEAPEEEVSAEK